MFNRNWIIAAASLLGLSIAPTIHAQQCTAAGGAFEGNAAQTGQANNASAAGKCPGNPIVIATGNTVEPEMDFTSHGQMGISLTRTYNKNWDGIGIFGKHWLSNFDYKLQFNTTSTTGTCYPKPGATCATPPTSVTTFWALRPDGRQVKYNYNATQAVWWEDKPSPISKIVRNTDGSYTLSGENHSVECYNASGYVLSIATEQGVGWTFTYDASNYLQRVTHISGRYVQFTWTGNQLTRVTDPQGNAFNYTYFANKLGAGLNVLYTATLPGGTFPTTVTYYYEDSRFPAALTGKDYNGTRYSTIAYDSAGRATFTQHGAGTMDKYTYVYTPGTGNTLSVVETTPLVRQNTYHFTNGLLDSVSGSGGTNGLSTSGTRTYDANGHDDLVTDFKGNVTNYDYAANGQLLQKVEAFNTPLARTTLFQWDADPTRNRRIKVTVVGVSETSFAYDSLARIASVTVKNLSAYGVANQTRTTTYSYTAYASGIMSSMTVDGPLPGTGDAVVSNFSSSGDLTSVTNSLGQTATYTVYNGLGEAGHVVDANGAITDTTYDARGRVVNVRTYPNGIAANVAYTFSGAGLLTAATTPDGVVQSYIYDDTRHMIGTSRSANGTIAGGAQIEEQDYAYDAMGDVTASYDYARTGSYQHQCTTWWIDGEGMRECTAWAQVWVGASTTTGSTSRSYDGEGRLWTVGGNNGQNVRTLYDANGNASTVTDSLGRVSTLTYDALNRVIKSVDAKGGITQFRYDADNNLTMVTDPRGLVTTYVYDGFGQLWAQSSPDSGTSSFTYNAYGQRTAMTRANGQGTGYGYDSLGRVAAVSASGQTQSFAYDTCSNGKGRVCQITDPSGQISYTYTPQGQVLTQSQTIGTDPAARIVGYAYDASGHLTGLSYPSGVTVGYGYVSGKVTTMTTTINGVTTTVAGSMTYQPYGGVNTWTTGNGLVRGRSYDLDGRLTGLSATPASGSPLQSLALTYHANDAITGIANAANTTQSQTYGYDELVRLTGVTSAGGNWTYGLDPASNRSSHTGPSGTVGLTVATTSNRLTGTTGASVRNFSYDANGNRIAESGANGTLGFAFDPFNRMSSATKNGVTTTYLVNALGQRVSKANTTTTRFVYGSGNALLGEIGNSAWTSYLWLGGELVGVVRNNTLYYVHGDQLGRPELATDASRNIVWRANNQAFDRTVTVNTIGGLNLGFPGQYYDAETGLWNNGFRDYDASLGRYVESDPIGLGGGINTFTYVNGNPSNYIDPLGEGWFDWVGGFIIKVGGILHGEEGPTPPPAPPTITQPSGAPPGGPPPPPPGGTPPPPGAPPAVPIASDFIFEDALQMSVLEAMSAEELAEMAALALLAL